MICTNHRRLWEWPMNTGKHAEAFWLSNKNANLNNNEIFLVPAQLAKIKSIEHIYHWQELGKFSIIFQVIPLIYWSFLSSGSCIRWMSLTLHLLGLSSSLLEEPQPDARSIIFFFCFLNFPSSWSFQHPYCSYTISPAGSSS